MKAVLLSVVALSLVISSCKKKDKDPEVVVVEEPKDEFVYRDLSPDVSLQSVNYFTNITQPCAHVAPVPADTSATYKLDVNGDNVADYELNVSHSLYTGTSYCGHCPKYEYYITLKGLEAQNLTAVNSQGGAKVFTETETVNKDFTFISSVALRLQSCQMTLDFSAGYLGIKMGETYGYLHVKKLETNGVQILDLGFNKAAGRSIKCGQK